MSRNYSNKNLTNLELGNIEFYLNESKNTEVWQLYSVLPKFDSWSFYKMQLCLDST